MLKRAVSILLCGTMLIMLFGCGAVPVTTENSGTSDAAPTEKGNTGASVPEDVIPQEPTVTESEAYYNRVNPPAQEEMADIIPFGNVPGIVPRRLETADLPDFREDAQQRRILFETEEVIFAADYGTYLVDGYVEKTHKILRAMETVTGLSFAQPERKLSVSLEKYGNGENDFYYGIGTDAEHRMIQFGQAEAFLGKSSGLIMGLADVLRYDNVPVVLTEILETGFQTYTAYAVLKLLEQEDPDLAMRFPHRSGLCPNYYIYDTELLYGQPLVHWLENGYPYEMSNGSASVGFWLMMYLDLSYGNYTEWLTKFTASEDGGTIAGQIESLKSAYGESVLEDFYPWLQAHMAQYEQAPEAYDYTWLSEYVHYPQFDVNGYSEVLIYGACKDLCISLEEFRHYMTECKGYEVNDLVLSKLTDNVVALYDADGKFVTATRGVQISTGEYHVFLDDVYYIRFPGENTLETKLICSINGAG